MRAVLPKIHGSEEAKLHPLCTTVKAKNWNVEKSTQWGKCILLCISWHLGILN